MPTLQSINQVDLTPLPGKTYFNFTREPREDFIYFLMVDRFYDGTTRTPVNGPGRSLGIKTPDDFYGGTIKGITQNLNYIAGLGCTAIWLSPIFVNNPKSYHGYNIQNYLDIDSHFGTKQDLIDLVDAAHNYKKGGNPSPLRIILDVVINHSGDNWAYPGGYAYKYHNNQQFPFGFWRNGSNSIIPNELQKEEYYHRRGEIVNWDSYPENQFGDVSNLKDYANDDDQIGADIVNILAKCFCYWIREADVDGFRVDAVKHMGTLASARFCSSVREYAYSLGKKGFFLFGEVATPDDDIVDRYIGQNTSRMDNNNTVFFGINSILDFRLIKGTSWDKGGLPSIIKGLIGPGPLFERIEAQRQRALNLGEIGRYLVTFIDNHDSFVNPSGRFGAGAPDDQIIAGIGYLLCSLGTACIYYGTEQGFEGRGGDNDIREAMFDNSTSLLNQNCTIYQEISKIAQIVREKEALRFGRMYFRQISDKPFDFGLPYPDSTKYTLAFSRILWGTKEILVAYNVSWQDHRKDYVVVDADSHKPGDQMKYIYGKTGFTTVQRNPDSTHYVQLDLAPRQFVILE